MKESEPLGGRALGTPLDPPMEYTLQVLPPSVRIILVQNAQMLWFLHVGVWSIYFI